MPLMRYVRCLEWAETLSKAAKDKGTDTDGRQSEAHLKSPATALIWNMLPQPPADVLR